MTQPSELISDDYRKLNASMHHGREGWGTTGQQWGKIVEALARQLNTTDVLDYGCGKGSLSQVMPFPIRQYDPAIAEHSALPEPANLVACLDVLEHIEPEHIDAVLDHLRQLVKNHGFFVIHLRPALNFLPDGRNAHILQRPARWWIPKLLDRFDIMEMRLSLPQLMVLVAPHGTVDTSV